MNEDNVKANSLRTFMIVAILIMIIGGGLGFYFAQNWLRQMAADNNALTAKIDENNKTTIKSSTDSGGSEMKELVTQTARMITLSDNFQIQTTTDLNKYAQEAGITITGIEPVADGTTEPGTIPELFTGIKSKKIIVSIGSPVSFVGLIKFIKALETNSPKLQITNMNISKVRANNDSVTVEPITVEGYVR
ncbi:MAG: hypothetical protein WCI79_01015 [Candidatus Saccharibacteria bacterium]